MHEVQTGSEVHQTPENAGDNRKRRYAAGGLIGAVLASSCCIAPLVLLTLGVSGAWIGNLTALEPYKPYFAAMTLVFIGLGFYQMYVKPKKACADGGYCARPQASIITQTALWIGTVLLVLALTINWWAPLFY
ncbi:mercuric transporter MerT family protein (plasmid) [Thalassobaculum sp. OXR-137]|uniref:mercuric transporter MerT family protein n=1 Tax=Thalassobaculum sp. OXR-137 TaxID=3100173 RepID=UPI002AC9EEE6|nr:mercuric transporter MerT family protein [Thalassobaculum sp. OXR-137]WPZ37149.1 mercuric transporter MerT family protein [Thalassobaculum sp. OXR-137]